MILHSKLPVVLLGQSWRFVTSCHETPSPQYGSMRLTPCRFYILSMALLLAILPLRWCYPPLTWRVNMFSLAYLNFSFPPLYFILRDIFCSFLSSRLHISVFRSIYWILVRRRFGLYPSRCPHPVVLGTIIPPPKGIVCTLPALR